ncbi:MAG TPA: deaminase [Magnetospirillaceae bacterium]|nr:deaminase [Magnetospirillaceae bacterium]
MNFDWSELAFGSKKPINSLAAIFIAAPREMSAKRFTQLVKTYLPQGNILLGTAKEQFIDGFEGQQQFKTLQVNTIQPIIDKVNASSPVYKIYTLAYFQRELVFILDKLSFKRVVFINGSWKQLFHTLPPYFVLANKRIDYDLVSPFADEDEAKTFAKRYDLGASDPTGTFTTDRMMDLADQAATRSFDNGFQTGVTLGRKKGTVYEFVAQAFNTVVPYQTYAWHFGAAREKHFSPMHDTNHYDTIHAEVSLLIQAQKRGIDLRGTTLFINLLPCPHCARMFTQTDITEFVYAHDHSEGYGFNMLTKAGKQVIRIAR